MNDHITVTKTVDATPEQLFALLATPARHHEFDGAGMLTGVDSGGVGGGGAGGGGGGGEVTGVGDQFLMNMHNDALGPYQILNTITAWVKDREIAWSPQLHPLDGYTDKLGDVQAKGHVWSWRFAPSGTGTEVTQVCDWSSVQDESVRGFFPMVTADQMARTIDNVADAAS